MKSTHMVLMPKNTKIVYSECLLRLGVLCVLCCSVCLFLYAQFCRVALTLDMSTLFTTFFLWTSLQFILDHFSSKRYGLSSINNCTSFIVGVLLIVHQSTELSDYLSSTSNRNGKILTFLPVMLFSHGFILSLWSRVIYVVMILSCHGYMLQCSHGTSGYKLTEYKHSQQKSFC